MHILIIGIYLHGDIYMVPKYMLNALVRLHQFLNAY